MPGDPRRGLAGRRRHQAGASAVEFAIVAAVYLLILFAIIEFGLMFWAHLTMQYAVREGARFAIADTGLPAATKYQQVIRVMQDSSMGLWDKVDPVITIRLDNGAPVSYEGAGSYAPGMFGAKNQLVVFQLDCRWPLLTGLVKPFFAGNEYTFSVAATMRNEAFE